jgi:eukaryotic-like serine/threonine-protein kinase
MALTSGTKLGPYEVIEMLGAGGMGEVYRARDSRLNREVAAKVLPAAFSRDQDRLHRFQQEARAAAALNNPNVLTVYDVGTENGAPYIVSELLEGQTLRTRLQAGPLPVKKAIDYTAQIARGLAAVHAKGILHRDLKPDNIFISREGQVKILDFGLAKLLDPRQVEGDTTRSLSSTPGMVVGTVGYISPEQVRGKPADTRSDLFSLGAILYEILTGERAFQGDTPADTLTAILTHDPPELASSGVAVPPMLENIVRHCLEKQPEERFQSARDIVFDLQQITLASSSTMPMQRFPSKGKLRYILGAVAAIALAGAGLLIGRHTQAAPPLPSFQQLTYRRGFVSAARFLPDGHTVIYSAAWNGGQNSLYTTRADLGGESALGTEAEVLSISKTGEMLVLRDQKPVFAFAMVGELDRLPVSGGGPRPIVDAVQDAVWADDGNIAVVRYVGQHYRLEYPLGKELFETNGFIRAPRLAPKNGQVAFLFHPVLGDDSGSVALVNTQGQMRELTSRFPTINGLAWSPSGNELWFSAVTAASRGGGIYGVNMKGEVRNILATPDRVSLLDVGDNGSILLSNQRQTATVMFSSPDLPADRDLAVSFWTTAVDISPDGKYLLLTDEATDPYTIVLAKSDGSPPVRLGQGEAVSISPDAKWVLASTVNAPEQYLLLPIGAGEAKQLTHDEIDRSVFAYWLPDSQRFLFNGSEPGRKMRGYMQDINGGPARPITPEGVTCGPVSPDGVHFITRDGSGATFLETLDGHSSASKLVVAASERVNGWLDLRHVYVYTPPIVRVIYSIDVITGKREVLKRIAVPDTAGVDAIVPVKVARDGKHLIYGVGRSLSDLHLVTGLR